MRTSLGNAQYYLQLGKFNRWAQIRRSCRGKFRRGAQAARLENLRIWTCDRLGTWNMIAGAKKTLTCFSRASKQWHLWTEPERQNCNLLSAAPGGRLRSDWVQQPVLETPRSKHTGVGAAENPNYTHTCPLILQNRCIYIYQPDTLGQYPTYAGVGVGGLAVSAHDFIPSRPCT